MDGSEFAKSVLGVCSVLFLVFGMVAIAFGALILEGHTCLQSDLKNVIACGALLIVGGVALFPAIILGTLGALRDSPTLLRVFVAPMLIAVVSMVVAVILLSFAKNPKYAQEWLETTIEKYDSSNVDKEFWDKLQKNYKCCGIDGYGDWKKRRIPLPESCCEKKPSYKSQKINKTCTAFGKDLGYINENGCSQGLIDAQRRFYVTTLCLQIAFDLCTIVAVGAAVWLVRGIIRGEVHT